MKHVMGNGSKTKLTSIQDGDVQPNAVDLRVCRIFRINENLFMISNDEKQHRGNQEVFPNDDGYFELDVGHYEIQMENIIRVGEGEAGWVITRSSFNRNGLYLTSGLYDSGYHGPMMAVLHVTCGPAAIKAGTRIGQYLSFDAETLLMYNGSYGYDSSGNVREEQSKLYGNH